MDRLLHKEHLNKLWLFILENRYLDKRYNRGLKLTSDKVNRERILIISSNSKIRQLQMNLFSNRF